LRIQHLEALVQPLYNFTIQGDFRVYDNWEESMRDHTKLFVDGVDWDPNLYEKVLLAKNYKEAAQALQDAGSSTNNLV
jgi:flagellum-specific peptidoglycan hydrolase FlgJ